MPESVLFKNVLPGHKPSDEQLLKLLEDRAECIEHVLDRVTLVELGRHKFLPSGFGHGQLTDLASREPEEIGGTHGYGLATQGIFMPAYLRDRDAKPGKWPRGRYYNLVGFSRNGKWFDVWVVEETVKSAMYIRAVDVVERTPLQLVRDFNISLCDLLDFLSEHMKKWAQASRERHEHLQYLSERFLSEDRILDAMCAQPKEECR